jgi:hypothetical protein
MAEGFPPEGASLADLSLSGSSSGYIVVGSLDAATSECPERRTAAFWESGDGGSWGKSDAENVDNATADLLPSEWFGWPVLGQSGSRGCPGSGPVVWNPTDKGEWFRSPDSDLDATDEVTDFLGLDWGARVASGFHDSGDGLEPHVWVGYNDLLTIDWHDAANPPPLANRTLESLSAKTETVIGFARTPTAEAWYSTDAGETWAASSFNLSYEHQITDVAAAEDGFYASGRACCTLPATSGGIVLYSPDGANWAATGPATVFPTPIETIAAWDGGLIALGEQTYLSADGVDWRFGPPLPGFEPRDHLLRASVIPFRLKVVAREQVVIISPTSVWYASADDLDPNRWPERIAGSPLPEIGHEYDYQLFTHCGPLNGSLQFDLRSWVPDLPEGHFPPSFDSYNERGTLHYVAQDRLEFTGRSGDVVVYHPSDDPPAAFPCA